MRNCSDCGREFETFAVGGGPHNRLCKDCYGNDGYTQIPEAVKDAQS